MACASTRPLLFTVRRAPVRRATSSRHSAPSAAAATSARVATTTLFVCMREHALRASPPDPTRNRKRNTRLHNVLCRFVQLHVTSFDGRTLFLLKAMVLRRVARGWALQRFSLEELEILKYFVFDGKIQYDASRGLAR